MPLPGACTRNASAVDPSRITRCGKSGQCSEPSKSRMRDGCFASAAFPTCTAFTVLNEICPDQATPELIDRGHRAFGEHRAVSQRVGAIGRIPAC